MRYLSNIGKEMQKVVFLQGKFSSGALLPDLGSAVGAPDPKISTPVPAYSSPSLGCLYESLVSSTHWFGFQELLMQILIKCADVSNETRPPEVSLPWMKKLFEEFGHQYDREIAVGVKETPFMNTRTVSKPSAQIGFIKYVLSRIFDLTVKSLTMTIIIRRRQIEFASVKLGYTLCHASVYCRMAHLWFDRHPTSSNLFTAIVQSVITYALPSFAGQWAVVTDPGSINALFRKALKRGLCQTSIEIDELIDTATNDCSVIYLAKSTVHIIFFHRNAMSVLLSPSEPEVVVRVSLGV